MQISVKAKKQQHHYFYVRDSHRNFIEDDSICEKLEPEGDEYTLKILQIQAAWSFDADPYYVASRKYGIEIRIRACECGMMFCQVIEAYTDGSYNERSEDCKGPCEHCEFSIF